MVTGLLPLCPLHCSFLHFLFFFGLHFCRKCSLFPGLKIDIFWRMRNLCCIKTSKHKTTLAFVADILICSHFRLLRITRNFDISRWLKFPRGISIRFWEGSMHQVDTAHFQVTGAYRSCCCKRFFRPQYFKKKKKPTTHGEDENGTTSAKRSNINHSQLHIIVKCTGM